MGEFSSFDWIVPSHILENTPSIRDGYSKESERQYRHRSALFIETLGQELKCERMVVSTASVLLHRFFVFQSMAKHNRFIISAACLFIAAKVEESYRPVKDVATAYKAVRSRAVNFNAESECNGLVEKLLLSERIILHTLCFDLQIEHPYIYCFQKTKALRSYLPAESRKEFHQSAVNFVNDSYRTSLCAQYRPEQLSIAALFLATIHLSLEPVITTNANNINKPISSAATTPSAAWLELMESDLDEATVRDICYQILNVYADSFTASMPGFSTLRSKLDDSSPKGGPSGSSNNPDNQHPPSSSDKYPPSSSSFDDDYTSSENKSNDLFNPPHPSSNSNNNNSSFTMPTKTLSYGRSTPGYQPSPYHPPPPPTPPMSTPPAYSNASSSPPAPPSSSNTPGYYIQLSSTRETPDYIPPPPSSDTPLLKPESTSWSTCDHIPPPPPPMNDGDTPSSCTFPVLSPLARARTLSEDESWMMFGGHTKRPRIETAN